MQRSTVAIIAVAFGFALWLVSLIVWHREPWDISFAGYCLALALAGVICAVLADSRRKRDALIWPAWIVAGQALVGLFRPDNWSLWPLSLIALSVLGVCAVIGASLGLAFRRH
ncbi:MAG TPA: hypothetical protein VFK31_10805 [Rhodanobacteraceae bacterium]|nr:hypothetical protein [Rhodanobacteraceae bacterium]